MNYFLWIITTILLMISFIKNRSKTVNALKKAKNKMLKITPVFLITMIIYSLIVTFIPAKVIENFIGSDSGLLGVLISLGIGSVAVLPGFVAFPLCAALKLQGIPYYILAAFSLSLMNIGIATFPLERKYLGLKVAILRNIFALVVCVISVIIFKLVMN